MSVLFPQREGAMFGKAWKLGTESVTSFINDGALSRGAAIAFYTVSSIGPVLLIVVAIAGLAFGQDAEQSSVSSTSLDRSPGTARHHRNRSFQRGAGR